MDVGTIHEQDILGSLWRLISGTLPTITSNAGLSNLQTASNKEPLSISDILFLKVLLFIYSFINKTFFWFSVKTKQKKMCTIKNLHERKNNKEKLISQRWYTWMLGLDNNAALPQVHIPQYAAVTKQYKKANT